MFESYFRNEVLNHAQPATVVGLLILGAARLPIGAHQIQKGLVAKPRDKASFKPKFMQFWVLSTLQP